MTKDEIDALERLLSEIPIYKDKVRELIAAARNWQRARDALVVYEETVGPLLDGKMSFVGARDRIIYAREKARVALAEIDRLEENSRG